MVVAPLITDTITEPMMLRPFVVTAVKQETHDTWTLDLEVADGGDSLTFAPGQFTMMYVFGVGEVPISIAGNPSHHGAAGRGWLWTRPAAPALGHRPAAVARRD